MGTAGPTRWTDVAQIFRGQSKAEDSHPRVVVAQAIAPLLWGLMAMAGGYFLWGAICSATSHQWRDESAYSCQHGFMRSLPKGEGAYWFKVKFV